MPGVARERFDERACVGLFPQRDGREMQAGRPTLCPVGQTLDVRLVELDVGVAQELR